MLVDVYNPFPWARMAGEERLDPEIKAVQRRDFDQVACRFIDRWWPIGDESRALAQTIRCHTPADLLLLLEGTGLTVRRLEVAGSVVEVDAGCQTRDDVFGRALSYLVQLVPAGQSAGLRA